MISLLPRTHRWWERWVGVRAPENVEAPCWWLVREVLCAETGVSLPEEGVFSPKAKWSRLLMRGSRSAEWHRLPEPVEMAVALIHLPAGWHIGLVVPPEPGEPWRLLSTAHRAGVLQRLDCYPARGFYEYHQTQNGARRGGVGR
jgi:hypothetical protein